MTMPTAMDVYLEGGQPGEQPTGGWTWDDVNREFPQLQRWPNWLIGILDLMDAVSSGQRAAPAANTMAYYRALLQAAGQGASDDQLDDIKNYFLSGGSMTAAPTAAAPTTARAATGGGSTAQLTQDQWFYNLLSPEQQEQWRQMQLGQPNPWQREQWQASQEAAARAYALQQQQFAWQQEQAARAEEERRKERVSEWNVRPSTWPQLWSMYGGDQGLPAGYTAPALEAGMNQPSWIAALSGQPQEAYTGSVPTKLPLGSLLRGAMEGKAAPTQAFAMPPGAGPLPSAQYLGKMPGSAVEGLGAAYESEWGLSWEDMVQAIQRSLPRRAAGQASSLGALRR